MGRNGSTASEFKNLSLNARAVLTTRQQQSLVRRSDSGLAPEVSLGGRPSVPAPGQPPSRWLSMRTRDEFPERSFLMLRSAVSLLLLLWNDAQSWWVWNENPALRRPDARAVALAEPTPRERASPKAVPGTTHIGKEALHSAGREAFGDELAYLCVLQIEHLLEMCVWTRLYCVACYSLRNTQKSSSHWL